MSKITDKDYFLPIIEAQIPIKVFSSGRNMPLLLTGVCRTSGIKNDYVVKFRNGKEMHPQSSCNELVALFLAKEIGINCVEPVLINISREFIEILKDESCYEVAKASEGINYGSKHAGPGFMDFILNQTFSDRILQQGQQIAAFDVLVCNTDRSAGGRHNMLTDGEDVVIFDHEAAFGFLYFFIKNTTPWLINDVDKAWIERHYFYSALKGGKFNFSTFVEGLENINEDFWIKVYTLVPEEWMIKMDEIKSNLNSIIENKSIFLQELNRVFS